MNVKVTTIAYAGAFLALGLLALKLVKDGKALGQGAAAAAGKVLDAINPTNPDNLVASTVNRTVQIVTGEKDATLGGKLAELLNPAVRAADAAMAAPVRLAPKVPTRYIGDLPIDPALDPDASWRDQLAAATREVYTDASDNIYQGTGGAAFGVYPRP